MVLSRGPNRVHHSAIVVEDVERSLTFWRDGLGLDVVMDQVFTGDWATLFGAPSDTLRSVFLGDPQQPDSGLVELVSFQGSGSPSSSEPSSELTAGFFLLSFYVALDQTLARLQAVGAVPRSAIEVRGLAGPVRMATVLDPDGVLVELIDSPR
jgi:catechol 2,3-dioxygenase-like lactoylglutathione lyase family enzyme